MLGIGFTAGPEIGKVLNSLLEKVIDESVPNEHESLMKLAEEFYKNGDEFYGTGKV